MSQSRNWCITLWFLILGGAVGGAILAVWRPRSPAVRLAGVIADAAAIAYIFTPLTDAEPEGTPRAFGINLRYLVPGISLAPMRTSISSRSRQRPSTSSRKLR